MTEFPNQASAFSPQSFFLTGTLWRVMIRSILRRPFQSILFALGVALGVAMIVSIDVANGSAIKSFGIFTESIAGHTTHQITGGPAGLPEDLYRQLRVDMGIRNVAPVVSAYVEALELNSQPLRVFGIDPFAEAPFRGYLKLSATSSNISTESLAVFMTQPNAVLMSETLAASNNLKAGDKLTLRYGPNRYTVTISALLRPDDNMTQQGLQDLLITDISTAQELLNMVGHLSNIDLILPDGAAGDALLKQIQGVLPKGATIQPATARSEAISQMTASFDLSLTALSLLALVVGMFLIYNTVTFSVVQRRPIIGTLRALGVTRDQIFRMILWEAALLSIVGAIVGMAAGVVMGRIAVIIVTQTVSSLYFTVSVRDVAIPLFTLVKGAGIGVGAALSAALLPAYEATTTPPSGTLKRSDIEGKVRRVVPLVTLAGLVLVIASALALASPQLEINFGGLFGIVVGFSLFTPLVALGLMNAIRPLTGTIFGVLGRMAPRSIIRTLSRTSVAVAALMVAVSVIVGVSAMVGSFRANVEEWLSNTITADILISPPSVSANRQDVPVDPSFATEVRQTPGVALVIANREVYVTRPGDSVPVALSAADADISRGHRRYVWSIGDGATVWKAMADGGILITEAFARHRGIEIGSGQQITLVTDKGVHTFPVVGISIDYTSDQGTIVMLADTYRAWYDDRAISSMGAFLQPGADLDTVIQALRARFAGRVELNVRSNKDLRASVLKVFDQTFAITSALNLLATIVAFIGILSALMALQLERTRELGTMRATGLTRGQLFRLTLIETGLMGGVAGLMAVPVGTVLAWVLIYIINIRSFGWSMQLELRPEFYTQAFVVSLVAALLAGIYPAFRMGRLQPAQAIRAE